MIVIVAEADCGVTPVALTVAVLGSDPVVSGTLMVSPETICMSLLSPPKTRPLRFALTRLIVPLS